MRLEFVWVGQRRQIGERDSPPSGVEADFRACESDSARCTVCMAGVDDVLVAPRPRNVGADVDVIRLAYMGRVL